MDPSLHHIKSTTRFSSNYLILVLLCLGALFIKNPKLYGIAITDISIFLGTLLALSYSYSTRAKVSNLILLLLLISFLLYAGIGIFKVPDKAVFIKYYARILKSFLVGLLGYVFYLKLNQEQQLRLLRFFFNLAVVSILLDTVYSLYYYTTQDSVNIWALYSSLKVSYLYADKNMVAFTISLLIVLSNRFFAKKYIFLLWFLTIISLSRSGILINTILLLYFMGFKLFKPSVIIALITTLIVTLFLVYYMGLYDMFTQRLSLNKDLSMQGRLGLQQMGINMWLDAPLTGQGLSGFEQKFYKFYRGGEETPFPHNFYIYKLSEQGLLGVLLLAAVFSIIWIKLRRKQLGMIIGAYLMFGMFLFNLSEYHFFFIVGLLLAYKLESHPIENRLRPAITS